ncbi:MAG: amino acid adenylation domain-containing protein, partial [Deltaproteobacteria bacterium]|nr:amino acid adenylation domain-containing protein [Deltaproteobacteria bacterium]
EYKGSLVYTWDALEELFPEPLLDDLFETYGGFLESLLSDQSSWDDPFVLSELPKNQEAVRKKVNSTHKSVVPCLLHAAFLDIAKMSGSRLAVIDSKDSLTYGELETISRLIALRLIDDGLKPGDMAAIIMDKGWEQIAAVLAIGRAGGTYLPIEPDLPDKRLNYLLGDAEVKVVLTQPHLAQRLSFLSTQKQFVSRDCFHFKDGQLEEIAKPEDLAYVIYTSGSTGQPKGVMIEHRSAYNTIFDLNNRLKISPDDRVFGLSSLSFDLSVYDIFGLLSAGGAVVYPPKEGLQNPVDWCKRLRENGVTIWNSTPSLMQMLLDYVQESVNDLPPKLRLVMLSGDWIPVNMPERLRKFYPQLTIAAMGGATEASIWSNIFMARDIPPDWKSIPYGLPLDNQEYHVLDSSLNPAPDYVPGDLYIAGSGLARGYLNDSQKTQLSFITHPKSGQRLYRTGDLGRYWSDGTLEFLGRRDSQVKVNGYRIELGEIEATMLACDGVSGACVAVIKADDGSARLAGFITVRPNESLDDGLNNEERLRLMEKEGVSLTDAVERLRYKQGRVNLRRDLDDCPRKPLDRDLDGQLAKYSRRLSSRRFLASELPLSKLSSLLDELRGLDCLDWPVVRYRYGSAGWTYPVQTYLLIKPGRIVGLEGGAYYYHPLEHELARLGSYPKPNGLFLGDNNKIFEEAALAIFLVAETKAIKPLYGHRSTNFSLIEAGLISQLLESAASQMEIGLCQIGDVNFDSLRELFRLNEDHQYLHCLLGGPVERKPGWLFTDGLSESMPKSAHNSNSDILEKVRSHLTNSLPSYMAPSTIIVTQAIPLSSNGKVDRAQLVKMALEKSTQAAYEAPRNPHEAKLA